MTFRLEIRLCQKAISSLYPIITVSGETEGLSVIILFVLFNKPNQTLKDIKTHIAWINIRRIIHAAI